MFVLNVLNNCGRRYVFCGLNPSTFGVKRMLLVASSRGRTARPPSVWTRRTAWRLPNHDAAFGMLTVSADLKIHIAQPLADAVRGDQLTRQYYGRPPLLDTVLLQDDAERPRRRYLNWHREKVFLA